MIGPALYHAPTPAEAASNSTRRSEVAHVLAHTTRVVGRTYDPGVLYDTVPVSDPDNDDPGRVHLVLIPRGRFAETIRRQSERDITTLPRFITALSRIGEFKEPPLPAVAAVRHDGTTVSGVSPEDAVIYGIPSPLLEHTLPVATMDFVASRLRGHTTNAVSRLGRRLPYDAPDNKDRIMDAWTRGTSEYDFDNARPKTSGVFATVRAYTDQRAGLMAAERRGKPLDDLEGSLDTLASSCLPQVKADLAQLGAALMDAAAPITVTPQSL